MVVLRTRCPKPSNDSTAATLAIWAGFHNVRVLIRICRCFPPRATDRTLRLEVNPTTAIAHFNECTQPLLGIAGGCNVAEVLDRCCDAPLVILLPQNAARLRHRANGRSAQPGQRLGQRPGAPRLRRKSAKRPKKRSLRRSIRSCNSSSVESISPISPQRDERTSSSFMYLRMIHGPHDLIGSDCPGDGASG